MRKKLLILLALTMCLSVAAHAAVPLCSEDSERKMQRKERRLQRMEEWKKDMREFNEGRKEDQKLNELLDSVSWVCAQTALDSCYFVVEADYVAFKNGYRIPVNSGTNFISLNGDRAVVQISPSPAVSGPNGVGGVTVKGTASRIEKKTDKKGRILWSMSVIGIGINAKVDIMLVPGSNKVTATVLPNFSSNNITIDGRLVPFNSSSAFEGMAL